VCLPMQWTILEPLRSSGALFLIVQWLFLGVCRALLGVYANEVDHSKALEILPPCKSSAWSTS